MQTNHSVTNTLTFSQHVGRFRLWMKKGKLPEELNHPDYWQKQKTTKAAVSHQWDERDFASNKVLNWLGCTMSNSHHCQLPSVYIQKQVKRKASFLKMLFSTPEANFKGRHNRNIISKQAISIKYLRKGILGSSETVLHLQYCYLQLFFRHHKKLVATLHVGALGKVMRYFQWLWERSALAIQDENSNNGCSVHELDFFCWKKR